MKNQEFQDTWLDNERWLKKLISGQNDLHNNNIN